MIEPRHGVLVSNAELATVREAMRELHRLLAALDHGEVEKIVLTQKNQMRAVRGLSGWLAEAAEVKLRSEALGDFWIAGRLSTARSAAISWRLPPPSFSSTCRALRRWRERAGPRCRCPDRCRSRRSLDDRPA